MGLFSAVISALNMIYSEISASKEKKRAFLEGLNVELKEFSDKILAWYNKITELVISLQSDLRHSEFNETQRNEYRKSLERIRETDEFYSKCHNFARSRIPRLLRQKSFSDELKQTLRQLSYSYLRFERVVFSMKNQVWQSLWRDMTQGQRIAFSNRIEKDFRKFKKSKNALLKTAAKV